MNQIALSKEEYLNLNLNPQRIEYLSRTDEYMIHVVALSSLVPLDMQAIFGKYNFIFTAEYRVKCWCFEHKNQKYILCTAPKRGMTVESTETDLDNILDFFKEVLKPFYAFEKIKIFLQSDKKEFEKIKVCSSCLSPGITDSDCICTYSNNYKTVELEFEKCRCCGNIDNHAANTEFNQKQGIYER